MEKKSQAATKFWVAHSSTESRAVSPSCHRFFLTKTSHLEMGTALTKGTNNVFKCIANLELDLEQSTNQVGRILKNPWAGDTISCMKFISCEDTDGPNHKNKTTNLKGFSTLLYKFTTWINVTLYLTTIFSVVCEGNSVALRKINRPVRSTMQALETSRCEV